MRISIIVPVRNGVGTLQSALESLRAQHRDDLEVIVMDGASTDGSADLARAFGAPVSQVISEPDAGQADALNKGFDMARGEIFGWLCADDRLLEGALDHVAARFSADPTLDVLTGGCRRSFPDGRETESRPAPDFLRAMPMLNPVEQPSTFWRRRACEAAGPLRTDLKYAFDWEYWCRLQQSGARWEATETILSNYVFSAYNLTSTGGRRIVEEMAEVIGAYGPYGGRLAIAYQLLYHAFDLRGFYDAPGAINKPAWQRGLFHLALQLLYVLFDKESINRYNWNWVSRQERHISGGTFN